MNLYKKRKIIILCSIITSFLMLFLMVSYSYFSAEIALDNSGKKTSIHSGVIGIDMEIISGDLKLCENYPILNETAINCEPLLLKVKADSNNKEAINYVLQFEKIGDSLVSSNELKLGFRECTNDSDCSSNDYTIVSLEDLIVNPEVYNMGATGYIIKSEKNMNPGEEKYYETILWIDYDNGKTQNSDITFGLSATGYTMDHDVDITDRVNLIVNLGFGESKQHISLNSYLPGTQIDLISPFSEYGEFLNWRINGESDAVINGSKLTIGEKNINLYAHWSYGTTFLSFDLNGGSTISIIEDKEYVVGSVLNLERPQKKDYYFIGWSVDDEIVALDSITVDTSKTYKANYAKKVIDYNYVAQTTANPEPYYTFTAPIDGYYQLETWGAQGGSYNDTYHGGYGGYSTGVVYLKRNQKLYVYIGGAGNVSDASTAGIVKGGYNGGGYSYTMASNCQNSAGSGGGMTLLSLVKDELNALNINDVLMISAGGGGALFRYCSNTDYVYSSGGSAGGYVGNSSENVNNYWKYVSATGGSQGGGGSGGTSNGESGSAAGTYGIGGQTLRTGGYTNAAGGGGGYYGGGAGMFIGGGGGSGYIGNTDLTDKSMYCYNCEESSVDSTRTVNTIGTNSLRDTTNCPNGYSSEPISKCAKSGNGYARITYLQNPTFNFDYIEPTEQNPKPYYIYTASKSGYYQLETWGAQGGSYDDTYHGGYGGYSKGLIYIASGEKIYIFVGGAGLSSCTDGYCVGGYNGGGLANDHNYGNSGGGATHISYSNFLLKDPTAKKEDVIIVAGGGGGAARRGEGYGDGSGGSGGGYIGSNGESVNHTNGYGYGIGLGGTQNDGGKLRWTSETNFPSEDYINSTKGGFGFGGINSSVGGGSGYYGGGSSSHGGAGGGSGYIGSSKLVSNSRYMYCYGCEESRVDSTRTINTMGTDSQRDTTNCPNGYSTEPISKCAKKGNGYAKISYVGK